MSQSKARLLELNARLAQNLTDKGIEATADETTTTLVDKVADIENIEIYNSPQGRLYAKNMVLTKLEANDNTNAHIDLYSNCSLLESVETNGDEWSGSSNNVFNACTNLSSATLRNITAYGHYYFRGCTNLKTAELGSIGMPVTTIAIYTFMNCIQSNLIITVYIDATTLAEIPTKVISNAPWGATNATIIYRNSTTGEVITE